MLSICSQVAPYGPQKLPLIIAPQKIALKYCPPNDPQNGPSKLALKNGPKMVPIRQPAGGLWPSADSIGGVWKIVTKEYFTFHLPITTLSLFSTTFTSKLQFTIYDYFLEAI